MTTWLTDFRYGVGALTASEHPALFQHSLTAYTSLQLNSGLVPIVGLVMPEAPDEVVALDVSQVSKDMETVLRVQFRFRAATEARLDAMEDALADTWQDRQNTDLAGVTLVLSSWASGASLGQDGTGRLMRSVNYYMTSARPLAQSA